MVKRDIYVLCDLERALRFDSITLDSAIPRQLATCHHFQVGVDSLGVKADLLQVGLLFNSVENLSPLALGIQQLLLGTKRASAANLEASAAGFLHHSWFHG